MPRSCLASRDQLWKTTKDEMYIFIFAFYLTTVYLLQTNICLRDWHKSFQTQRPNEDGRSGTEKDKGRRSFYVLEGLWVCVFALQECENIRCKAFCWKERYVCFVCRWLFVFVKKKMTMAKRSDVSDLYADSTASDVASYWRMPKQISLLCLNLPQGMFVFLVVWYLWHKLSPTKSKFQIKFSWLKIFSR